MLYDQSGQSKIERGSTREGDVLGFFDTPIEQLTETDLLRLRDDETPESLYLEYKQDFPKRKGAEASVAAFANSYGGRLLLGVRSDPGRNVITELPGLDPGTSPQETLNNRVRDGIAPVPLYRSHLFPLSNGNVVLVAETPESSSTPHVMRGSGVIYVRSPVSSDPVPADDRATIDRLYARRERTSAEVEGWLDAQFRFFSRRTGADNVLFLVRLVPVRSGPPLIPDLFSKAAQQDILSVFHSQFQGGFNYLMDQTGISLDIRNRSSGQGVQLRVDQNGGVTRAMYIPADQAEVTYVGELNRTTAPQYINLASITRRLEDLLRGCGELYGRLGFSGTVRFQLDVSPLDGTGLRYMDSNGISRGSWTEADQETRLTVRRDALVAGLTGDPAASVSSIEREVMRSFGVEVYEP